MKGRQKSVGRHASIPARPPRCHTIIAANVCFSGKSSNRNRIRCVSTGAGAIVRAADRRTEPRPPPSPAAARLLRPSCLRLVQVALGRPNPAEERTVLSNDELSDGITFILKLRDAAGEPVQWAQKLSGDAARHW